MAKSASQQVTTFASDLEAMSRLRWSAGKNAAAGELLVGTI
jgi:hypothetical protein